MKKGDLDELLKTWGAWHRQQGRGYAAASFGRAGGKIRARSNPPRATEIPAAVGELIAMLERLRTANPTAALVIVYRYRHDTRLPDAVARCVPAALEELGRVYEGFR